MKKRADLEKARELAQTYSQPLVEFCQELVRTPSVNGKDFERKISQLVAGKAKKLDLPQALIALDENRPNVFIGTNYDTKAGLLFVAHLDTVPTGNESKWKHSPFEAAIDGGKLFGRGAIDCKAGIALSIYALKILHDLGKPNLAKFAAVVDEESGADSKLSARYLLDKGLNAAAVIYTYPGIDTVTIGHRGLVRLWIEAHGEAAHTGSKSWQDGTKGASAIEALVGFVGRLSEITMPGSHDAFPGYTFMHTPTIIQGGSGESIVPDKAKVLVDARLLPNHDNEVYIRKVKALAEKSRRGKVSFNVLIKTEIPGVAISPNEKIVQILRKLDEEVMGIKPEIRGSGPASEGYMFVKAGIPTICGFGAEGDGVHSTDEYLKLDSLSKILEIYVKAAIEISS
jgi:acetylornithine deacetylase/succinyl-diaminopimelate desuccinylase-like protein